MSNHLINYTYDYLNGGSGSVEGCDIIDIEEVTKESVTNAILNLWAPRIETMKNRQNIYKQMGISFNLGIIKSIKKI